jgi:hypothetical protein
MRNVWLSAPAQCPQRPNDQSRRCESIDVEIAVDGHSLFPAQRPSDPGDRIVHALKGKGIGFVQATIQESGHPIRIPDTSIVEHLHEQPV